MSTPKPLASLVAEWCNIADDPHRYTDHESRIRHAEELEALLKEWDEQLAKDDFGDGNIDVSAMWVRSAMLGTSEVSTPLPQIGQTVAIKLPVRYKNG